MQFCQNHWDNLKKAIHDKGLGSFIAKDGIEAAKQMYNEASGIPNPVPNPLIMAHTMILDQAINQLGFYVMGETPEGGHYCPLCEVRSKYAELKGEDNVDQEWIEGCTTAEVIFYKEKGFIDENGNPIQQPIVNPKDN